jgi:hypothetical protein
MAVAAKWRKVEKNAQGYTFAEQVTIPPFKQWPDSNYATFGTNSNTFIRWLVGASSMTMVEMSGSHPGDATPSRNPPHFGGSFSAQHPPKRK